MLSMQVTLYLSNLIMLASVVTALTLSLILWCVRAGNLRANRWLSIYLLVTAALSALVVIKLESLIPREQGFTFFSLQLALGPLLYFYTRLMTDGGFVIDRRRYLLHFAPVFLSAVVWQIQLSIFVVNEAPGSRCPLGIEDCTSLSDLRLLHRWAAIGSMLAYAVAALIVLRPHLERIKQSYSTIDDVKLSWLKVLNWVFLVAVTIALCFELRSLFVDDSVVSAGLIILYAPLLLSALMAAFGVWQSEIITKIPTGELTDNAESSPKYKTSSLTDAQTREIWSELQQVMSIERPYLAHGLKISDLATQIDIPTNHLSETINGYAGQSFYEYINLYRVDDAKQLLSDATKDQLSIIDIGLEAGFKSNSTFYTQFKKYQGQTPLQYRKQFI
jgi:AraC-like DNA-binding protein